MADFDDPAYRQWEKKFYESIGASGQKTLLPTVSGEAAQNRMRGLYPDAPLEPIINSLREYYREPKNIVNTLLDFIPGVGDLKSGTEAVVGETATGEPLSWWERLISGAGALPLVPSAMGIMKGMKSEGKMSKALKETPKTPKVGSQEILYHGSSEPITSFNLKQTQDMGIHLGTKAQAASRTQGRPSPNLIPVRLNIPEERIIELPDIFNRPARSGSPYADIVQDVYGRVNLKWHERASLLEWAEEADNVADVEFSRGEFGDASVKKFWQTLRRILKDHGYDAVKYWNEIEGEGYSYAVLDPKKIKIVKPLPNPSAPLESVK